VIGELFRAGVYLDCDILLLATAAGMAKPAFARLIGDVVDDAAPSRDQCLTADPYTRLANSNLPARPD
jgi:hypothetical protein